MVEGYGHPPPGPVCSHIAPGNLASPQTGRMLLPFEKLKAAEPAIEFTLPAGKAGEVNEELLP